MCVCVCVCERERERESESEREREREREREHYSQSIMCEIGNKANWSSNAVGLHISEIFRHKSRAPQYQ